MGESEYMRYDAATTRQAIDWLATECPTAHTPWCLWVSYTLPHSPFVASAEDIARYPLEEMELPVNFRSPDWPHHPHIDYIREQRIQSPDEQLDETLVRRTIATYLAMCTYLDRQVGAVLAALTDQGLECSTRVIYTSDHGEMLGDHGMWGKNLMYEGASAVPFLMAGPDIARGPGHPPARLVGRSVSDHRGRCRRLPHPGGCRSTGPVALAGRPGRPAARTHDLWRVPRLRLPRGHVHAARRDP